jgi:hypothetical protein
VGLRWSCAGCPAFFAWLLAAFVETACAGWSQGAGVGAGLADGGDRGDANCGRICRGSFGEYALEIYFVAGELIGGEGAGEFRADCFAAEDEGVFVARGALDATCVVGWCGWGRLRGGLGAAWDAEGGDAQSDDDSIHAGLVHRVLLHPVVMECGVEVFGAICAGQAVRASDDH